MAINETPLWWYNQIIKEKRMSITKAKKIYFVGVGGIGMSAIARYTLTTGKEVAGSDLKSSAVTKQLEKEGIKINYSQVAENITDDIDLIVYSASVPVSNPELCVAKEKGIKTATYGEALGMIFNVKKGIAICGTHGKSTVTAMTGAVLEDGDLDPSVLVGSIVPRYQGNLRVGKGEIFVAEACEYRKNFISLYPQIIALNNIELDHTDYYENVEKMKDAFAEFCEHLPTNGVLFANGDSKETREVAQRIQTQKPNVQIFYFGKNNQNDFYFQNFETEKGKTIFDVFHQEKNLGKFVLKVPGEINALNALVAVAIGVYFGIDIQEIKMSLENFSGIWRRFEVKGEYRGALIISDYAHHPTAVKETLKAAKEFYPNKRIVAIFQPHQHNRLRGLYNDFVCAFDFADQIILSEIYDVTGREEKEDQNISSCDLARDIEKHNPKLAGKVAYTENLSETMQLIKEKVCSDDVVLIMGAGDIFEIADELVKEK